MNGAAARRVNGMQRIPSGLLYAATCTPIYVELAFLSAESFRQRYPHAPIILFTDQPEHPLARLGMFNVVTTIATDSAIGASWSRGQFARIQALSLSPFERTLHVDCDTRFVGDITPALTILDHADIAMVECVVDRSMSRRLYGKRMFNAGMCSYRLTPAVRMLFSEWAARSRLNFTTMGTPEQEKLVSYSKLSHLTDTERQQLLGFDQTTLVEIWSPEINACGVRGATLSYAYNCTFSPDPQNRSEMPRIVSHQSFKETTLSDLLLVAQRWRTAGKGVDARQIAEYVASQWVPAPPPRPSQPSFLLPRR
jgi:hypothetical protein